MHLKTQPEPVDCQLLEPVVEVFQICIREIDTDSDSDVPDLIDHQGNIVH